MEVFLPYYLLYFRLLCELSWALKIFQDFKAQAFLLITQTA